MRRDNDKTKDSAPMMHPKFTKALSRKRFDQHFQANRKQLDHLQATELDTTSIIHCTPTLAKSLNLYIIFKDLQGIYIYINRDTLLDHTNAGCRQKLIAPLGCLPTLSRGRHRSPEIK